MTDFMPLFIFSNTLQTPLNILQKPLKHPSTPFQTPFKIISFFYSQNGWGKNRDFIKGGRVGLLFLKWFHKKIFNLTNDYFPNLDSKPHLLFSLSFKLLNHSLIIHPFQQTNTEGQAVDGDQDKELWICLIWCKFHSVVNSCQWLPICELLVFPQGKT